MKIKAEICFVRGMDFNLAIQRIRQIQRKSVFRVDKHINLLYIITCSQQFRKVNMHEWLSGGVSPCQGEGRGFESRLVLNKAKDSSLEGSFDLFKY